MVRASAGLPLGERISHVDAQRRSSRTAAVPAEGTGSTRGLLFEDDGESWGYKRGMRYGWVEMTCGASRQTRISTPAATVLAESAEAVITGGKSVSCW
ncbi:hypothetical protein MJ561_10025 [Klebsiella pneumoniae]|nr:hypothetical protein MJ561_10025 [Klebsiella pneumoniae]